MTLEEPRLFGEVGVEIAARKARHDLEQDRDVIFRFPRRSDALDAEQAQILAHPRQWTFVQKAGQIVGGIGQQFAAAEPDEEVEKLLARSAIVGRCGSGSKFEMGDAEIGRVALQRRDTLECLAVGALPSSSDNRPYSAARS